MKKILLLMMMSFCCLFVAKAQTPDQQVSAGTEHTYTAVSSEGLTFEWTVSAGGTTTDLTTQTGNDVKFTWGDTPGMYTLSVVTTDANNCKSEPMTKTIEVVGEGFVQFADASDNVEGICSFVSTMENGSNTFDIEYTGARPWKLTYSIIGYDGNPVTGFDNLETEEIATATYTLTVVNQFVNETGADQIWKVVIIGATSHDHVTSNPTSGKEERTISVHTVPTISDIQLN